MGALLYADVINSQPLHRYYHLLFTTTADELSTRDTVVAPLAA